VGLTEATAAGPLPTTATSTATGIHDRIILRIPTAPFIALPELTINDAGTSASTDLAHSGHELLPGRALPTSLAF
jgi:hypothetical protein